MPKIESKSWPDSCVKGVKTLSEKTAVFLNQLYFHEGVCEALITTRISVGSWPGFNASFLINFVQS